VAVPLAIRELKVAGIEHPEDKIHLLTHKEIVSRVVEDLDDRLQARAAGKLFVYEVNNGREDVVFSDANENTLEQLLGFSPAAKEICGMSAYKGTARGHARIVFHSGAVFFNGDILVSINSSPKLMPYIIKCAAIVTDEGGLGCHAAIISRELRKPCIIGTKIATKVLHDGDMVEVNATNGVVKKIK
ncbi:MAG: PEP-utilizing enzyme, partial [Patescibacteria group bacterium]